jgi:hypothetical protein
VEDGLSLSTVSGLLAVVTALTLRGERVLALLVLCHLVRSSDMSLPVKEQNIKSASIRVFAACLALADWIPHESAKVEGPSSTKRTGPAGPTIRRIKNECYSNDNHNALGNVDHVDGGGRRGGDESGGKRRTICAV